MHSELQGKFSKLFVRVTEPIVFGNRPRTLSAIDGVEWYDGLAKQRRDACKTFCTAWRALIVIRPSFSDRFRIRAASRIAALGALRLRQQGIDALRKHSYSASEIRQPGGLPDRCAF